MRSVFSLGFSFSFLMLASCASIKIGGRTYEADQVNAVKSVAIVGLEIVQPKAFNPMDPTIGNDSDTPMGSVNFSLPKPDAGKMPYYNSLNNFLKSDLKYNVLPLNAVVKNATYQRFYKNSTEGMQSRTPYMNKSEENFAIPELMDMDSVSKLGVAGRDELMRVLKVDAIIVQRYHVTFEGTNVMGVGSFKPKTTVFFQMYRKGIETPVWQNMRAEGVAVEESVGKTRLTVDMSKVDKLALQSAPSAYKTLVEKKN